ncbi:MAG: putative DNA-binding domain-containing protein [Rhizobiaceae bacterium]|nr:putative DNA-binding domain-containing protein [Rhizobiaceae bacterium]
MSAFAATQADFAQALTNPAQPVPIGLTTTDGRNDPLRFAVYRNNVFVGLTQALAKRFPVTRRLVGEEFFAGMARVYADAEKPASPLLFRYGDTFPDFIATFPPAASLPYLADLARLETALTRAYHAADVAPLGLDVLSAIAPDTLPRTVLLPHPSAAQLVSAWPVGTIWAAHQGEIVGTVASRAAETVIVARPVMDVGVHVVPANHAGFSAAVFEGATLGDAAARALDSDAAFDFGAALVGLVSLGAFSAVRLNGEEA